MAKTNLSDTEQVDRHLESIEPISRATVDYLRTLFLNTDDEISEHVKWNSIAFYFNGQMAEFDAKEYKRDLAVINLHRSKILIVFPTGNKIDDAVGLKGKNYPDGRKIVEILNIAEAQALSEKLQTGIKDWLSKVERY
ncbi:DUF1801 domain-containing protein [Flavobacterium sp. MAH-1]|uniref:DUF1801 domain-containing protein n=1 Tax=Flavobacterium agri TaxID=2743471 RepID=A0A7Y9C6C9_9FLAO|nr:DUF1801 domain-containing protein [Flavobacterium agri]NUY81305.1 DUF1801 domain-containing protein [Flavobacterium agri]NYA71329.1 DUF1801 domain-containing protein [Flavobacterium agri]